MKFRYVFFLLLVVSISLFSLSACKNESKNDNSDTQENKAATGNLPLNESLKIDKAITVDNLTIYPIVHKKPPMAKDYISLEKGLEAKTVEVKEVGSDSNINSNNSSPGNSVTIPLNNNNSNNNSEPSNNELQQLNLNNSINSAGTVNAVEITNNSDKKLYILAGEVIIGGKQDRMITVDVLIEPKSTKKVDVCCVERGRWRTRESSQDLKFTNVGKANIPMGIKMYTLDKGTAAQSEVWAKVASSNTAINNENTSDTYNKVITHNEETIEKNTKVINDSLANVKDVCGFIICINGEIKGVELFASPSILKLYEERLVNSFILEALMVEKKGDKTKTISNDDLKEYLNEFVQNKDKAVVSGDSKFITTNQTGYNSGFFFKMSDDDDAKIPMHSTSFANEPAEKNSDK